MAVVDGAPTPPPAALAGIDDADAMTGAALYARAAGLGLGYKAAFQTVTGVVHRGLRADVALAAPEAPAGLLLPPTLLDGAFQGLVALAADLLPGGGDGVVPWRFGRVCLLRPDGAVPATARLAVTRVGPRSVRADIHLLDATGEAVAALFDCWFVRVQIGAGASRPEGWAYHTVALPSPAPDEAFTAGGLLHLVAGTDGAPPPDEAALLAEAFTAAAVAEAFHAALPSPDAAFTLAGLVAAGVLPATQRDRCAELLAWLQADGLATVADGTWRLAPAADAPADDILRTLVFDERAMASEAALLAGAAGMLAACLAGTPAAAVPVLAEHLLDASPAGQAAGLALADRLARVACAWPDGHVLRVLHVGARRGALSRLLLRAAGATGCALRFHALTAPADQPALADALAGFPDAVATAWQPAEPPANLGRFDVVIGHAALSLDGMDVLALLPHAADGLVLLAEPGPARTWSLLWPAAALALRGGPAWEAALAGAGVADVGCEKIPGGAGANLLSGRVMAAVPSAPVALDAIALLAEPGSALASAGRASRIVATHCPRSRRTPSRGAGVLHASHSAWASAPSLKGRMSCSPWTSASANSCASAQIARSVR